MFKAINNTKKIYAFLLAFAIVASTFVAAPLSVSAKSSKKKEVKITNTAGEWQKDSGAWCFVKPDGTKALNEWVAYDGAWFYFKQNGRMAENEWVKQGNARYFIKPDATMAENQWVSYGGAWYWLKSGGAMAANEWLQNGSKWYWLKSDGKMAANEKLRIDGKNHNFDGSGQWLGADLTREQLYAAEVARLVNIERENNGLRPLSSDNTFLNAAAMLRASEDASGGYREYREDGVWFYPHRRPDGRSFSTAYADVGGKKAKVLGENIAWGQWTPSEVMQDWMDSPGHRENILEPSYSHIGVGVVTGKNGIIYWSQMFYG